MKKVLYICVITTLFMSAFSSCDKEEYNSYSSVYGSITDVDTGDLLPDATVFLSPGGMTKVTGSDGMFEFKDIDPQQYTITVQKTGYKTNRKSFTAIVGETIEINITLTTQ